MSDTIDMEKIGLKPREMQVLQAAAWARTQVPNGHYLCSPGQNRAAERMITRGFLTKAEHDFSPPSPGWIVVKLTEDNYSAMRGAEASALSQADRSKTPLNPGASSHPAESAGTKTGGGE